MGSITLPKGGSENQVHETSSCRDCKAGCDSGWCGIDSTVMQWGKEIADDGLPARCPLRNGPVTLRLKE